MIVDGEMHPLDDARYLLSPGDLYALHHVPEICDIGVTTLKIEGRYKDAEYVALTTAAYRQAVDEAWAGRALSITPQEELRLEQVYSRGLGPWFLTGTDHQAVVQGRAPRHRGVLMGRVVRVTDAGIAIEPSEAQDIAPLKPGDGVVFDAADWRSPEEREEGGRVYQVTQIPSGRLRLEFANNAIDFDRIRVGDWVWRSHDPDIDKICRPFTHAESPVHKQPIRAFVTARAGEPLRIEWTVLNEKTPVHTAVQSGMALGPSEKYPATIEYFRDKLGRLGNTPYTLAGIDGVIE